MIDKDDLRKSCFQLNVNLDDELLDSLFDCCDLDKDGLINYLEFANFLNWKNKMAVKEFEEKIISKGRWLNTGKLWRWSCSYNSSWKEIAVVDWVLL